VRVQVDEKGNVARAQVISQRNGYGFEEAALRIVQVARFTPGYLKGRPVRMSHRLPISFVLEN
jgi:periplasmic protein TonB